MKRLTKASALFALTGAGTLWGLGFVFGKIAISEMPVGAMLAFRFTIATALLLPVLFIKRRHFTISTRDYRWIALAGLLYVPVQFILQFEGLARTSVSHASLMVATVPALLALVAAIFTRRRPNGITAVAVVAAVAGAGIVAANASNGAHVSGDVLVLVSLFAAVAWIMITDRKLGAYDPVASTAVMLAIGTIVLIAFEAFMHGRDLIAAYPLRAWLAVIACGVLSTAFSTMLWNLGLQRIDASEAGIFINLEPVVGAACGVVFFGDPLGWQLLAGGAVVLAAALTISLRNAYDDRERGATGAIHAKDSTALGFRVFDLRGLRRAAWVDARFRWKPATNTVNNNGGVHRAASDPSEE